MSSETYQIRLERMSFGPAAVGRLELAGQEKPMVVFVNYGAPNDLVEVEIIKKHKNYWDGRIIKILEPSPQRVKAPCSHFGSCGGCQWQHLSYSAQLEAKKQVLFHQIQRTARYDQAELDQIFEFLPAPHPLEYRHRIQVRGKGKELGFYKSGSKELIDIDQCLIVAPELQKKWSSFKASNQGDKLKPEARSSYFKLEWTLQENGEISEAINREHAALGFTQVNPEQNEVMVNTVTQLALDSCGPKERNFCLDLYAGSGNLSQKLINHFDSTLCVEAYGPGASAKNTPKLNKPKTHIREFIDQFLEPKTFKSLLTKWELPTPDLVIADPPRDGLEKSATPIAQLGAKNVILVSCDPATFARDLCSFKNNYRLDKLYLIDMFPQTYHIEVIALLKQTS